MCGIFGSIGYGQYGPEKIQFIKGSLNHRGPDAFGTFADVKKSIFLAHTRLSIIDLSTTGSQPMVDPETGNVIVFNGEIYNFEDIRSALQKEGASFSGTSDTEVLLKGYRIFGEKILDKLVGMFAFAIWDNNKNYLLLARDRMGEKPLYFSQLNEGKFIFASELTALLVDSELSRTINHQALLHFLQYGYTATQNSILNAINKLEPAHYIIVSHGKVIHKEEYWKLNHFFLNKQNITESDAIEKCQDLLLEASSHQLMADVPVGVFLSGGVDSGLITGISKEIKSPLSTFSAGFDEPEFDERPKSAKVASSFNTDHTSFSLGSPSFDEILKPYQSCDEPFGDTSAMPTYYLAKLTRNQVKVCLSGDGGDELFGGYSTYLADKAYQSTRLLPRNLFSGASVLTKYIPSTHGKVGLDYKLKAFFQAAANDFQTAHTNWRQLFSPEEIILLITPELREDLMAAINKPHESQSYWKDVKGAHFLDQAMYFDLKTWLVNDILYKVDRMSMANSLELRAPFLDHRIVEFAASLPVNLKLRGWKTKYILKELASNKLGLDYKKDKKLGFNAPASRWIANYSKLVQEYLISSQLFDNAFITRLIQEHVNFTRDNNHRLMALIGLVAWKNKILESRV